MSLREISIIAKGEMFRHEVTKKISFQGAWMAAGLERQKRLPSLKRFMRDSFPPPPGSREAQREVEAAWEAWATQHNFKVIRGGH